MKDRKCPNCNVTDYYIIKSAKVKIVYRGPITTTHSPVLKKGGAVFCCGCDKQIGSQGSIDNEIWWYKK